MYSSVVDFCQRCVIFITVLCTVKMLYLFSGSVMDGLNSFCLSDYADCQSKIGPEEDATDDAGLPEGELKNRNDGGHE